MAKTRLASKSGETDKTVKAAFIKSLPVMAGYIIPGIRFGFSARSAGYPYKKLKEEHA